VPLVLDMVYQASLRQTLNKGGSSTIMNFVDRKCIFKRNYEKCFDWEFIF
jgi:hypothetical protein